MVELGKIERPEAGDYSGRKKLFCLRNVYLPEKPPEEYVTLFHAYWDEVVKQLEKMEYAGKVEKIFCENVSESDPDILGTLGKTNERLAQMVKKRLEDGGTLVPLEKEEIFAPYIDWGNCLLVVRTKEVFEKVYGFYTEWSGKRYEHILDIIGKNLSQGEAGILIMRDEDRARIQFPKDIEVFLVTPPSYDNILRWLREQIKNRGGSEDTDDREGKE